MVGIQSSTKTSELLHEFLRMQLWKVNLTPVSTSSLIFIIYIFSTRNYYFFLFDNGYTKLYIKQEHNLPTFTL